MGMNDSAGMTRKLTTLRDLSRERAPAKDLWPGIVARIEGRAPPTSVGVPRHGTSWRQMPWALAAGVAALVVGILLGRVTLPGDVTSTAGSIEVGRGGFIDAKYVAERDRLQTRVLAQIASLPPAERARVVNSVRTLQRAVDEIQTALGRNPSSALLQGLLVDACQDEMTNLNDINLATGGTPAHKVETLL